MTPQTPAVPRPVAARPWRVWLTMLAVLSLLVLYDSARFQRFLLDTELQAAELQAALAPSWARDAVRTVHEALGRAVAFWARVEAVKKATGMTAVTELERDVTRRAADLLVLDLAAAPGGSARISGDGVDRGVTMIEAEPGAEGQGARPPVFLLVGDSVMLSPLGTILGERLQRGLGGRVVRRGIVGTGLSRPDKFDWAVQLRKLIAQHSPQAVVVLMGVNDVNATRNAAGQLEAFGSDAFRATYVNNVRGFLRAAQQEGVPVIWVETPVTENPDLNGKLKAVNDLQRAVAAEFVGARYVDTWSLLADSEGRPRPYLRLDNERQFHPWNIDGIHLSPEAGKYVADAIFPRMTEPAGGAPAAPPAGAAPLPAPESAGPVRRYRYLSRVLGRDTDLFYVPGAGAGQPPGTTLVIFYRHATAPLERWIGLALLPLTRRHGIAAVVQEEPALVDAGGRPRPWPDTPRAVEQYLSELRRAAERAGDAGPFGGLLVISEGGAAGAGVSLLARVSLPCMSLLAAPAEPARVAVETPDTEEPPAPSAPGRMASVARETAVAANSPLNRALRERLRPAGFVPRTYGGAQPGQRWEDQVARHIAWHSLCDRLRDRAWPGPGDEGGKALFDAVEFDLPEMAAALLARGVSPQRRDPEGNSPLIRAVRANRRKMVALLLAGGADPDVRNDDGWTALAAAAARGNIPLAQRLLAAGARVDVRDRQGRTPLMVAAWQGFPGMVDALVQALARVDARDRTGETPLHKAAKYGKRSTMERLIAAGANVNQGDSRGKTALMTAAFYGQTDAAAALIGYGTAVDVRDGGGWTALLAAASTGKLDTVRLLVERGADPLALANDRKSALILAGCEGHAALVPYLLSVRAEREGRDAAGQTALLCAARKGRTAAVKALLQAGAEADAADPQGNTALLMASRENGIELAEALLKAGADPDRRNAAGDSPRSIAAAKGHDRILQLFSKGSGRGRRPGAR